MSPRVERALADPGPYLLLHRCIWPDGAIHWIECRGRVTVDEEGAPTGTVGVAIDVTPGEERAGAMVRAAREERNVVETLQRAILPTVLPIGAGRLGRHATSRPPARPSSAATGTP